MEVRHPRWRAGRGETGISSIPHRRLQTALAVVLPLFTMPAAAESFVHSGEEDEGVISALSLDRTSNSSHGLRKLGENPTPEAAKLLVSFASDPTITEDPVRRLALIVALHEHCRGPERLRIVLALLSLFEEEGRDGSAESASLRATDARGEMKYRARGAAALALAKTRHPLALRLLFARAAQGADLDPIGAELSARALQTIPKDAWKDKGLASLRPLPPSSLSSEQKGADAGAVKSPTELVTLATRLEPESNAGSQGERWSVALRTLARSERLPPEFLSEDAWQEAFEKDRTSTLRSLACLSALLPSSAWRLTEDLSTRSLRSKDLNERHAAAFALAVVAPEKAAKLFETQDPVVIGALLGQATEGPLARAAHSFARQKKLKKKHAELQLVARENADFEPTLWEKHKTSDLWSLKEGETTHQISILSSRLSETNGGLAPRLQVVMDWLTSENPEVRSAAALGLGHATSPSTVGLLLRAYRTEADPTVRRAIVASLARHKLMSKERLKEVVALDPDPGVQERGGIKQPRAAHFFVELGRSQKAKITHAEGQTSWVIPAPDGFVGWVEPPR